MIHIFLVFLSLAAAPAVAGKTNTPATVTEALAKAEDVSTSWFEKVQVEKLMSAFRLTYFRSHGDGGGENCEVLYDIEGQLKSHYCRIDYVSHSMGPENAESVSLLLRVFEKDQSVKVLGSYRKTRLKDKKVVENRSIINEKDEKVKSFTKPVMVMPVNLLVNAVK